MQAECQLGVDNTDFEDDAFDADKKPIIEKCPKHDLTLGFNISGKRVPMWFLGGNPPDSSLTWVLQGKFAFPRDLLASSISKDGRMNIRWLDVGTPRESLAIHICSFWGVGQWVAVWGKELRRRGWITSAAPDENIIDPNRRSFDLCGRPSQMEIIGSSDLDQCLTWYIRGGFQFNINDVDTPQENISIQIDSFPQIEEWGKVWTKEIRSQGWSGI